ncbi:hypothetical protein Pmar_PMAR029656 [Perkinsus marinus ATCC 50983]|uniref:Uncharacterized protein n=1 Tax=Perkinsus marinus (strain ATCC 50983 / TXsc) TaxID=423536 RepID=C5LPG1_PERM5|nr:hypothetical protein Pmar_PMAR029656 [Perkinsus marinus ATCC 50983]EER01382.1 hypothetical protein Pmar_PMAR029656 [Perkinsus marinus ATCC 50983]|eukprot:XP_002768664.1 hypothetical protein Pmar_PMAR029656 [Perkinsus marinus ATCC 50983]
MAPRAVSTIGDKDLPLATSELDMTIQSCLDYVCSGKALEFSGVTTQIGRSVYNGLKAVSKDDLPEEGLTVEIVKQYLLDTVGYFCTTFGVEDCNNFEDNMVCYLLPVLVESDLLLKKPSESELRDLRHDKIAATKDLAFDPFSFFSPTFPQYFSQLHQPDPTVEAAVVAAPKPAVGDGLLFSASPVETGFPAVKSVSTSSKDPRHDVLGLLPKFELKDAVITSQERRQARKSVKDIELLKGGVFTGKGDSRSMRRVLTYVRDVAIEEAFTALEYRELLKRQISQTARAAVHPRRVTTQPALIQELRREVSSFLSLYGQGDSGKLDSWKSLLFLSQGKSEKVATFAQRFDDAYNDAVCLGNVIDDAQAALQFASALNERMVD